MKYAVEVNHISVTKDRDRILEDVTWRVPAGKIVGVLGPSGAGKTTLMRSIMGLQRLASGTITVLGRPAGDAQLRHEVGYVTQAPSVYADLTVRENLRYFGAVVGVSNEQVEAVIEDVELEGVAHLLVAKLSGGQHTRVSLAVALLGRPRLLVLDEPTVGLDPLLRRSLWAYFAKLAKDGATLIVTSHVMDEAEHCDRLLLLREGRIVADDTPDGLRTKTVSATVEDAFLRLVEAHS